MKAAATMLALALVAADLTAQTHSGPLQQDLRAQLKTRLYGIASGLDGVLGFVIIDLTSKETVAAHLETQQFPTASTIKLAILYELLKQSEEGKLALDKPERLDRAQIVGGSGV